MNTDPALLNPSTTPQAPEIIRSVKLVVLTEIIAPYRIPVFNALARTPGIDLHVIFLAETDPTQRQWLVYKDEIRFSYEVLPSWRQRIGKYHLLLNRGLSRALRRANPDVIVSGGYNHAAPWQTIWWARQSDVPFMVWVESTAADRRNRHPLIEFLKRQFMKRCQGFIVAGKSSAEYVKQFGVPDDLIFPAPDAVDTEFFTQKAAAARENPEALRQKLGLPQRFFLFVGRMIEEKGGFDLLQAYNELPMELRGLIGLVFVGEGTARAELQRRAATIHPGIVKFAGFAQRDELPAFYALAEAFIFPTHSDPWGLVVNEAMASGLPIICSSAAGCAADLVEDKWNGRVVNAGDVATLTSAMLELARDAKMRAQMGEHSLERIQLHSPECCAAGIAAAAQSIGVSRHV